MTRTKRADRMRPGPSLMAERHRERGWPTSACEAVLVCAQASQRWEMSFSRLEE